MQFLNILPKFRAVLNRELTRLELAPDGAVAGTAHHEVTETCAALGCSNVALGSGHLYRCEGCKKPVFGR